MKNVFEVLGFKKSRKAFEKMRQELDERLTDQSKVKTTEELIGYVEKWTPDGEDPIDDHNWVWWLKCCYMISKEIVEIKRRLDDEK